MSDALSPTSIVDSHLHAWDLEVGAYAWLGPQHGPLNRSFPIDEAAGVLAGAGVGSAILVQAEDSETDTRYLLESRERYPSLVAGVIGWVCLDDPRMTADQLERYGDRLVGVRHLVHDDPRPDFLALPAVLDSVRLVAERGLALDVPDAWPRHLGDATALARAVPGLTVVIDHLAKPPRGSTPDEWGAWATALRRAAAEPNVVGKLSGLQAPGQPFTVEELRPVVDVALDAFGADHLMYGGDWPLTVPDGGYQRHWAVVSALLDELGTDERAAILQGTATRTYGLAEQSTSAG